MSFLKSFEYADLLFNKTLLSVPFFLCVEIVNLCFRICFRNRKFKRTAFIFEKKKNCNMMFVFTVTFDPFNATWIEM